MSTIHVTIDDTNQALAVVATLLNQGFEVSIDLDEVDDFEFPVASDTTTKRWHDGRVETRRERIDRQRAEADEHIAERDRLNAEREARLAARAAVVERKMRQAAAVDAEIRQQAYDERYAEAQAAQFVECPSCGAEADNPCVTPQGKPYGAFVHIDRIQAAYMARQP